MKASLIIIPVLFFISCSQHTINKSKSLSREYTTIKFSNSYKHYKVKTEVGGEQINSTTIIAKANESYIIEVKANNNNLNFDIVGKSLTIQILDNNSFKRKVTTTVSTEISLSFSAYPDSSFYEVTVTKS